MYPMFNKNQNDSIAHQTGNESIDSTQKDTTLEEMDTKMSQLNM